MSSAEQQEEEADHISSAVDTTDAGADDLEEKKFLQEEEEIESNIILASSSNHQTAGSTNITATQKNSFWYAAPKYWQDADSTSHHNDDGDEWEHLFLDLFYVPAISNLSELLTSVVEDHPEALHELSGSAMLCFFAVFFAVWYSWYHQCVYECKFIAKDTFHRFVNRGRLIFVAVSIYQIIGYEEFVGKENERSFYFCLGITVECFISLCLRVETLIMTRDDDEVVRNDSIITVGFELCPRLAFYAAAWITQKYSEQWPWLVLCGALVPSLFFMFVQHFNHTYVSPMRHQVFIPRVASWVSIVIGEGIIALLNPGPFRREDDLRSTVLGIITLTILHSIYFSDHGQISASDKVRGGVQTILIAFMSIAFIGIGVASKQGTNIQNIFLNIKDTTWNNSTSFNATIPEHPSNTAYYYTQHQAVLVDEENDFNGTSSIQISEKYYLKINQAYSNQTYFLCLPALLFFLEAIFWTNPAYVSKVRCLFQEEWGRGTKTLVALGFVLQLAALLTVAITGNLNEGMMSLEPVYVHLIGCLLSAAFLLSRLMVVSALQ
jgi:low temperature requirement protein LtrA